jgi:hypothetical protein
LSLQWCSSDDVLQLLLALTALSVGAAHKKLAAAGSGAATSGNCTSMRSSSSNGSSKHSGRRSSTAAALQLLVALSPPLLEQLSRRYVRTPGASDFGSFNSNHSAEEDQQHAVRVLSGLMHVLMVRSEMMKNSNMLRRAAASSSSSSTSNVASLWGLSRCITVVPGEQQLLLPLVLAVIELLLLLPAPQHGVTHIGLQMIVHIMRTARFVPAAARNAAAAAGAAPAPPAPPAAAASPDLDVPYTEAAVEALAGLVLLQVGPAVMAYMREVPAAPNCTAASMQAMLEGVNAGDVASVEVVRGAFSIMATLIITAGALMRVVCKEEV